ncbi:MAG: hypothetical protein IKU28_08115 [Erysipelotrichaceae bacterium]|nr:hypothetical protein [Erysipelotrichaceae bacterium]
MNKKISIKMSCLMEAIEQASDFSTCLYDLEKQENVWLFEEFPDDELEEMIEDQFERFVHLPDQYDIHEYRFMIAFIDQVQDERIRMKLDRAVRGKGAFRRFKDCLLYEEIEKQWYAFLDNAHREFAAQWCNEKGYDLIMDEQ